MKRTPVNSEDIKKIADQFQVEGGVKSYKKITTGHIHSTYHLLIGSNEKISEFILQKLNKEVFLYPQQIMQNIRKVSEHLFLSNYPKLILKPIPLSNSDSFLVQHEGDFWRLFPFYKNTMTCDTVQSESMAYDVAFTFGEYVRYLDDLDPKELHIPIRDFHNTPIRFSNLLKIIESADQQRLIKAQEVISKVKKRIDLLSFYNCMPQHTRVIHSDTKLNNVLLDADSHKAVCVIDLDTLMPGNLSNDFGDMIRTMTPLVDENNPNINEAVVRRDILLAVSEGFLKGLDNAIRLGEKENLYKGAALIIYEQAIRFLTDYLNMDIYYPVSYDTQNLIRAQNQLHLLEDYLSIQYNMSVL